MIENLSIVNKILKNINNNKLKQPIKDTKSMTNLNKLQAPFERLKHYDIYPDIALRKAIIMQAIFDACSTSKDRKAKRNRQEAITWLLGNSKYFKQICFEAELCHNMVRKIAKNEISRSILVARKNFTKELYKDNLKIYDLNKANIRG